VSVIVHVSREILVATGAAPRLLSIVAAHLLPTG